mgnify:CR=1 FL=1
MKYSRVKLTNINGLNLSISNLIYTLDRKASVMDIYDAIEDAEDKTDLVSRLNNVYSILEKFVLDEIRETENYLRVVSFDPFGNKHYLTIYK